ncbi:MAG: D-hexose-6-phosphate mutarotase [Akkermansia sp.]|nr:D-hexose-6-phosphate mutarotase [Akkermansia sp.]
MVTTVYPYGEDFPILKIETALCTAEISLYGGHVLSWAPAGHKPVIYMSPKAVFKKGKALRGGIPLCWPWFGKNTEDASLPSHGIARISTWQVGRCEEGEDGRVNLLLALPPENEMLPSGALAMEIGNELTMSLITLDVPRAMPYSAAMHTYFAVSDYEQVAVTGLEELAFTEFAGDAIPHPEDPLIPLGHIDRIYHPVPENAEITIHDPAWERSIRICRAGSGSAVVWNPGAALAAGMGDLGEGNERGFLAVETTVVPAENIMLRCGETHELTTRIQVFGVN